MNESNRGRFSFTPVGISSLILIFVVIGLVSFACLSLSTAKREYDMSLKNAQYKKAYYEACNRGEEFLASYYSGKESDGEATFPIDESQALFIRMDGNTIEEYRIISTDKRDYSQNLELIK